MCFEHCFSRCPQKRIYNSNLQNDYPLEPVNYRQIKVKQAPAKVCERLLLQQMLRHVEEHKTV